VANAPRVSILTQMHLAVWEIILAIGFLLAVTVAAVVSEVNDLTCSPLVLVSRYARPVIWPRSGWRARHATAYTYLPISSVSASQFGSLLT